MHSNHFVIAGKSCGFVSLSRPLTFPTFQDRSIRFEEVKTEFAAKLKKIEDELKGKEADFKAAQHEAEQLLKKADVFAICLPSPLVSVSSFFPLCRTKS